MKLLHSLVQRQIDQSYPTIPKQINLDFTIAAMKCHKDDQHKIKGLNTEVPPFACRFNQSLLRGHMLAVVDEDGGVCLFDVRKRGPSSKLKGWIAHSNAIFDIAWMHDEPKLITASGDQTAQLWDVQHSTRLAIFRGHSCSLKSVDFQDENLFVFATGARDGNVMLWDIRCNKRDGYYQPVNTIHNCHSMQTSTTPQRTKRRGRRPSVTVAPDSQQSVTCVKFQDMKTIISAGAVDGNVKVWDLRKNYSTIRAEPVPSHMFPYPGCGTRKHGFSSLVLDSNKSRLFANCTNDVIYTYNCISFNKTPLASFRGHSNGTFYVKSAVSPDDQFLVSGSGDCDAYVWKIDQPDAAPFHLTGHVSEVTSVAWCPKDQAKVVTCSDDNSVNFWQVNFEETDKSEFVGWCERKASLDLPSEAKDNQQSKTEMPVTPNTSPCRSRSSSASSSPVSCSPSQVKCASPQQFLQSWLKSSTHQNSSSSTDSENINNNKRARECDSHGVSRNKRCCLEPNVETSVPNNPTVREDVKILRPMTAKKCGEEKSHHYSGQDSDNSDIPLKSSKTADWEENKENIHLNENIQKTDGRPVRAGSLHQFEEKIGSVKLTYHLPGEKRDKPDGTDNGAKREGQKLNCLNGMGATLRTRNPKRVLKDSASEQKSRRKSSSQPTSPLATKSSSPDKELTDAVSSMKCIREYFKPLTESDEDSPSKNCDS